MRNKWSELVFLIQEDKYYFLDLGERYSWLAYKFIQKEQMQNKGRMLVYVKKKTSRNLGIGGGKSC